MAEQNSTAHFGNVERMRGVPRTMCWPRRVLGLAALSAMVVGSAAAWRYARWHPDHAEEARRSVEPELRTRLRRLGSALGAPAFIRIFKRERVLELWVRSSQRFVLLEKYPICHFSGTLGPKTREGDLQAPEGLYSIAIDQLNPRSHFYLSIDLGYPNRFETARGWTGHSLMIHGDCVSIGCYAMGDRAIAEIYTIVREALLNGQAAVPVHAMPFPLNAENLRGEARSPFHRYWTSLSTAYIAFERDRVPPRVEATPTGYRVTGAAQ